MYMVDGLVAEHFMRDISLNSYRIGLSDSSHFVLAAGLPGAAPGVSDCPFAMDSQRDDSS